jgi:hypothetical protein
MKRYTLADYSIYRDNGSWVAVRTGPDSVRRNVAWPGCTTKRSAVQDAREDRDYLNYGSLTDKTVELGIRLGR